MRKMNKLFVTITTIGILALTGCGDKSTGELKNHIGNTESEGTLAPCKNESTCETVARLVENYKDDGNVNSTLEALTKYFYNELKKDPKYIEHNAQEDFEDDYFYRTGVDILTWEECQAIEYDAFDSYEGPEKYYLIPVLESGEDWVGDPLIIAIPKGYAKLEDLAVDGLSIYGPMEYKGISFDFYMSEISESEMEYIRDWEPYLQDMTETWNVRDIELGMLYSGVMSNIGIYDSMANGSYTRNVVVAKNVGRNHFNENLLFKITIPINPDENPDDVADVDTCIALMSGIGFQGADYFDVIRCWKEFNIDTTYKTVEADDRYE